MNNRIVFIDSHIANYQSLIVQLPQNTEAILLEAERDGIEQILAALQGKTNLDAIDIISHGSPGIITLGSGILNNGNLNDYKAQLAQIGQHLTDGGDILLYGCEVAQGETGQRFIEQLSLLTGADVAASTNLTGATELGGDWMLDAWMGAIQTKAMRFSYDDVLASNGEFRVNTTVANDQQSPTITALADGGFVVSWVSDFQDGSFGGIYAQRYNADGTVRGGEFQVNTTVTDGQSGPTITALADGGFVVSWESNDGDGSGIYAQRYNADGTVQGGEFQVNTMVASEQHSPTITALADGGFVVSWQSFGQDGDGFGIYAQRYNADGTVQGGEFQVNTYVTSWQESPTITALADGGFVVSWQSDFQDGAGGGIYAQRYNADGTVRGAEFQVNTTVFSVQTSPTITALADGGFVVSWVSDDQDGSRLGIYAQRYNADGTVQGAEFQVNTTVANDQQSPTITALADGGFVVSWVSDFQDGSFGGIYAQRYNADGTVQGGEFQVNTTVANDQTSPTITALADGGFVVSWVSPDGSGDGIYAQRYDANGIEVLSNPNCFLRSTRVLTRYGYCPVEELAIGDELRTLNGGWQPLRWIGHQRIATPFGLVKGAPVRITAGAFGPALPEQDVFVSQEHAIFFRNHLIPAKSLINGVTVFLDTTVADIEYFHLLLDRHDVIFSEGLATESYVPCENIDWFDNTSECPEALLNAIRAGTAECLSECYPRCVTGTIVETARALLARFAPAEVKDRSVG